MNIFKETNTLLKRLQSIQLDWSLLEIPQDRTLWDIAFPCFIYAKQLRQSPQAIAQQLSEEINALIISNDSIEKAEAVWPYINFFIKQDVLANNVLSSIHEQWSTYGSCDKTWEIILIESPWPNTNKPLHLWHVRNMLLGNALGSILRFSWHTVHSIDIVNDRWIHICKSMLAYQRLWNGELPTSKSDHYVWKRYVKFASELKDNPSWDDDAQAMLRQREAKDPEIIALWEKMRDWAISWQQQTYKRYWTTIEKTYFESDHYLRGKKIVEQWVQSWLFTTNEKWHIVFIDETMGEKVLLRTDGTSIYITQDIALWKLRYEDRKMNRMIYVVWNEQEHHFSFLFKIFDALWLPFADKCHHLSYGMVSLPDGKMKSREWTVVDADPLADETHQASFDLLKERYPDLGDNELHQRAEKIAMSAIKFFFLKYDASKDFVYNKENSLRFDWETWPYIQYTYARCCSILKKATDNGIDYTNDNDTVYWGKYSLLISPEARHLLLLLNDFPFVIDDASLRYQPYLIARFLLDLWHAFNVYYQKHTIVDIDNHQLSSARCALVDATREVIGIGLNLLWIETLEEM